MKKSISLLMFVIIFVNSCSFGSNAATDKTSYSWYCKHMKNGAVPECDPKMKFIEEHDGFYVDRNVKEDNKKIYLTFDAGYENGNVEKIVDILKEKNVTGAFFVLENFIKKEPELVKKMALNGDLICNHTAKHRDMTTVKSKTEFEKELRSLEKH